VAGWGIIMYGVIGLLDNAGDTRPSDLVRWFVGGAIVHDGFAAPLVCGAGLLLARLVPARARGPVQGGLLVSTVVVLFAWPFLRGYGLRPDNPSALPNNYGAGLLVVLAAIWLVCGALVLWRRRS
jgi:hypothetical protein